MNKHILLVIIAFFAGMSGCSYLGSTFQQARLSVLQKQSPTQRVYKHMLDSENFFVFGKIRNGNGLNEEVIAVVAISDQFQASEVVDVSSLYRNNNSFYGLNLPVGHYQLLVVSDLNRDGYYDEKEVVGGRPVALGLDKKPAKVLGEFDIDLDAPFNLAPTIVFHLQVRKSEALAESLFFPKGSIRSLDDEIFSRKMATLGMYEPAAFLEEAPMMFYALEEDLGYKVPVVFVHGIDGSARDFADIVAKLDRSRYRAWFFFYPSGEDLSQLSEMFYNIFLSGKTMVLGDMPMVIVAHSMGGLVVRDALNRQSGKERETKVSRLITIASPLGGHPAAAMATQGPVVIPSWRDVAPNSDFMHHLRRKKLSAHRHEEKQTIIEDLIRGCTGILDDRCQLATSIIDSTIGQLRINTLADNLGIHIRGLERLFETQIGLSPKKLTLPKEIGVTPVDIDGMHGEWITPQKGKQDKVILFFHGGGYVSGSCADHRIHVSKFVGGTNIAALLFEYRLAPENSYPAALEDSVKAYQWLLAQGFSSSDIVFAGDSAGGGLCLATLLALKETATPLPAAAVALSPWTDLHCTGESYRTNAQICLSPEGTWTAFSRHYVGESDAELPLISPLYGNLQGLPPLFISVGGSEILLDDSVNFAGKVKEAQGDVTLLIGEGLFHCYPVCTPIFPEATKAMEEICAFIKNRLERVENLQ